MEFKITKQKVLELHDSACDELKKQIEENFPEAFKTVLEVGKWYKIGDDPSYLLNFQNKDERENYGFVNCHWGNDWVFEEFHELLAVEATHEEVKEAFEKEIIKRFGKDWKNAKIKQCLYNGELEPKHYSCIPILLSLNNLAWNRNGCIFKDGVWAEPLIEKTTITKEKALEIIAEKLNVLTENIIIE